MKKNTRYIYICKHDAFINNRVRIVHVSSISDSHFLIEESHAMYICLLSRLVQYLFRVSDLTPGYFARHKQVVQF